MANLMTGAQMVFQALEDQGVKHIFGYPGGAVLPIYDELKNHKNIKHILVRHEQGAGHAAEGYARSTGRPGVILVTSGPGATNTVTALTDAYMDSIPLVCITGQVPTHLIGTDAFQECDTTGITRPCTKHNWLVKDIKKLSSILHKAFEVATSGRPGPVLVDIPKDIQFKKGKYVKPKILKKDNSKNNFTINGLDKNINEVVELFKKSSRPILYTGGGVINSGTKATKLLRELVACTGFPITSTLQGLGAFPGNDQQFLGMLGMHGTYEANNAMHDCDLMINIGARFDDRITGKMDEFSPKSKKIHIDIDPSSINKNIEVDIALVGDVKFVLEKLISVFKEKNPDFANSNKQKISAWWNQIETWRKKNSLGFVNSDKVIKPQFAVQRLYELTRAQDTFITTEVGQHQMWAAQHYKFDKPNRWINSGGLGTMGFGLPAAMGVKLAYPKSDVICVTGEASILMCIQELATCLQYRLPIKVINLNNRYMGMVRQWQEFFYEGRYAMSYMEALPDFTQLANSFGHIGIQIDKPSDLEPKLKEAMKMKDRLVFVDVITDQEENVYPMIKSGQAHNEMHLSPTSKDTELA